MAVKENSLSAPLIEELVSIRKNAKLSQKQLEQKTGIKQQLIGRVETGASNPQLETILRILFPLGMTLAIVPNDAQSAGNEEPSE